MVQQNMSYKGLGFVLLSVLLVGSCYVPKKAPKGRDLSRYDFREGDVLLQHLPGRLTSVIADVTSSQYSHCGMVVRNGGRLCVIEAIGPVRYTSLTSWIGRDRRGKFTQLRPVKLSDRQRIAVVRQAKALLGRPYDIQYELDEEKIYCSELVYKAYRRGADLEVGKREKLGELKWRPHEKFIRYICNGELPLERVMVTPESLVSKGVLKPVYTNFPPRSDAPKYDASVVGGKWHGDYTVKGLESARASLEFRECVSKDWTLADCFIRGSIQLKNGAKVRIVSFTIKKIDEKGRIDAVLKDSRGIHAAIRARICDKGNRIIGTWKDNHRYSGVLSFARQE